MSRLAGWRPALRLAWRDAVRAKGRSALVLVMIALPVLAVTGAAVVMRTSDVSAVEGIDRRMGAADALVFTDPDPSPAVQGVDPERNMIYVEGEPRSSPFDLDDLADALGRDTRAIELRTGGADLRVGPALVEAAAFEVDLGDELAAGLFDLEEGAWPRDSDEVVINRELASRGISLGDRLELERADSSPVVVGIGEDATMRSWPVVAGRPDSLGLATGEVRQRWLVRSGPVSWSDVLAVNELGAYVVSRAVLLDPPADDELPVEAQSSAGSGRDPATAATLALVVTMALLEVVLLAGPAFAVGARRQSRALAILAANGGTPAQARRVVLSSGIVLGGVAAAAGVVLGIGVAAAAIPLVQRLSGAWFGPFEVPWRVAAAIAAFGLLSAFLAAIVPAVIASRQDVVAVLAGRRGDRPPSLKSPLVGVVLLGAGVAGAGYGAVAEQVNFIALSAVVSVLGTILLVPVVLSLLARVAARLPLPLRFAARDAARHRTRTVPAVAAVAATVAGVVALGIGAASDAEENRETYTRMLATGDASVTIWDQYDKGTDTTTAPTADDWEQAAALVARVAPDAVVEPLRAVSSLTPDGDHVYAAFLTTDRDTPLMRFGSPLASSILVSDDAVPALVEITSDETRADAERALAQGSAVVFTQTGATGDEVLIDVVRSVDGMDSSTTSSRQPTLFVPVSEYSPVEAVLPSAMAEELGLPMGVGGLHVRGATISPDQETDLQESLRGAVGESSVYVERGYQDDDQTRILLLILGALATVLMVGGTLTATLLALADARPDLATLASVGASPRSRRFVAASYAVVVGVVGAVLGAVVGFIPGLAIARPLTSVGDGLSMMGSGTMGGVSTSTGPYLDVPWMLISTIVVALPLLTALVVGLSARSRLPLAARLE